MDLFEGTQNVYYVRVLLYGTNMPNFQIRCRLSARSILGVRSPYLKFGSNNAGTELPLLTFSKFQLLWSIISPGSRPVTQFGLEHWVYVTLTKEYQFHKCLSNRGYYRSEIVVQRSRSRRKPHPLNQNTHCAPSRFISDGFYGKSGCWYSIRVIAERMCAKWMSTKRRVCTVSGKKCAPGASCLSLTLSSLLQQIA